MNIVCRNIRRKRTLYIFFPLDERCYSDMTPLTPPSLTHYLSQTEHQWRRQPQLSGHGEGSPQGQSPPHQSPGMIGCYFQSQVTRRSIVYSPTCLWSPPGWTDRPRSLSPSARTAQERQPPNTSDSSLWFIEYMISACMNDEALVRVTYGDGDQTRPAERRASLHTA